MKQAAHGFHRVLVAVNLARLKHLPLGELRERHLTAELVTPHKRVYITALETLIDRLDPQPAISEAEVSAALHRVLQTAQSSSQPHDVMQGVLPQARNTRRPPRGLIVFAAIVALTALLAAGALASRMNLFTYLFGTEVTTVKGGIMELEDDGAYRTLGDALRASGLDETGPNWIPPRYALNSVTARDVEAVEKYRLIYAWYAGEVEGAGISVKAYIISQGANNFILAAFENGERRDSIHYNGIEHQITENLGQYRALWESFDGTIWSISGDITLEELEQIIKSVYEE